MATATRGKHVGSGLMSCGMRRVCIYVWVDGCELGRRGEEAREEESD